jgi:hypothetical protein
MDNEELKIIWKEAAVALSSLRKTSESSFRIANVPTEVFGDLPSGILQRFM